MPKSIQQHPIILKVSRSDLGRLHIEIPSKLKKEFIPGEYVEIVKIKSTQRARRT
jgi:hypothetical protein